MNPKTKNLLIVGGLLLSAAAVFSVKKLRNLKYAFDNMTIGQYGWVDPNSIEIVRPFAPDGVFKFKTDIKLVNMSDEDFSLNAGVLVTLKKLAFIYNGLTVGYANVNISDIEVPAYGQKIVEDIPVVLPTANLLNNIANIPDMIDKFKIIGYVDVLGTEYLIGS